MKSYEPFKIPIWEFEQLDIDNDILTAYCLEYEKNNPSAEKSNQGGYQSPNLLLNQLEICTLVSEIEWKLREIQETPLVISNIWFNVNRYGNSNLPHLHPMSHYSGVYYVKAPNKLCGNIHLEHPALDLLYHYPNGGKDALFIGEAKEKTLYIFPSWLKHYVSPNLNEDQERISISFNTTNGGG